MRFSYVNTLVGRILAVADDEGLRRIAFADVMPADWPEEDWVEEPSRFSDLSEQLSAYFAGELRSFDLLLAPEGTRFQHQVWEAVKSIPYGRVATYADLARQLGKPNTARAVGAANACNPLPIVIPCHRVVGSDGEMVGYLGGIARKRSLLRLEQTGIVEEVKP